MSEIPEEDFGVTVQKLPVPPGFNAQNPGHVKVLTEKLEERLGVSGWSLDRVDASDPENPRLVFTRQTSLSRITSGPGLTAKIDLIPTDSKASAAQSVADKYERDQNRSNPPQEGKTWKLTSFEPNHGRATLSQMTEGEIACRDSLAAVFAKKPWEISVRSTPTGGYDFSLPQTYLPSKHDGKIEEVATSVVGQEGWYTRLDPVKRKGRIIPSEPPTFPAVIPTPMPSTVKPFDHLDKADREVCLGMELPDPGSMNGRPFILNMKSGQHAQFGGTSGAGKSVTINAYVAHWLSKHAELAIIDLPSKAVDFEWCKKYVRPGWWGCDGPASAAYVITSVMKEAERRARYIKSHGVADWWDLPAGKGLKPIVVIIDEVTGLYAKEEVPRTTKNSPEALIEIAERAEEKNMFKAMLQTNVQRVAAELRAAGVMVLIATQIASTATGLTTALRTNLHHKVLLGVKPTEGNRKLVFSDIDRVPQVPENLRTDAAAGRGVGSAEPEGGTPCVFKSFYASTEAYGEWLNSLGVPVYQNQEPTREQINNLLLGGMGSDEDTERRREAAGDPVAKKLGMDAAMDYKGDGLKGAAAAAANNKAQMAAMKRLNEQNQGGGL